MFSDTVMDHFTNPRHVGTLASPDAVGKAGTPGRGNYMVLQLRVDGDRIVDCAYMTFGCPPAIAAGSVLTEIILGMRTGDALRITAEHLEEALGGLPLGRRHCAALAVQALRAALSAALPNASSDT